MCSEVCWGLEILKVVPTGILGSIAAYIAWRQFRIGAEQRQIASAKLKLDLFEKRLAVFEATWRAASDVIRGGRAYPPAYLTNLYPHVAFLFGPEVEEYMKTLAEKMTRLGTIDQLSEKNGDVVPPELVNEHAQHRDWISHAAIEGIRSKFSPYLGFSQWW